MPRNARPTIYGPGPANNRYYLSNVEENPAPVKLVWSPATAELHLEVEYHPYRNRGCWEYRLPHVPTIRTAVAILDDAADIIATAYSISEAHALLCEYMQELVDEDPTAWVQLWSADDWYDTTVLEDLLTQGTVAGLVEALEATNAAEGDGTEYNPYIYGIRDAVERVANRMLA